MSLRVELAGAALLLLSMAGEASAQDVVMRRPLPATTTSAQGCQASGTCGTPTTPVTPPTCTTDSNVTTCCVTQSDGSSSCCTPSAGQTTCNPPTTPVTPQQQPTCAPGSDSYDTSQAAWITGDWVDSGDGCNKTRDVYCGAPDNCTDASSGTPITVTKRLDDSVCLNQGPFGPINLGPVN